MTTLNFKAVENVSKGFTISVSEDLRPVLQFDEIEINYFGNLLGYHVGNHEWNKVTLIVSKSDFDSYDIPLNCSINWNVDWLTNADGKEVKFEVKLFISKLTNVPGDNVEMTFHINHACQIQIN